MNLISLGMKSDTPTVWTSPHSGVSGGPGYIQWLRITHQNPGFAATLSSNSQRVKWLDAALDLKTWQPWSPCEKISPMKPPVSTVSSQGVLPSARPHFDPLHDEKSLAASSRKRLGNVRRICGRLCGRNGGVSQHFGHLPHLRSHC